VCVIYSVPRLSQMPEYIHQFLPLFRQRTVTAFKSTNSDSVSNEATRIVSSYSVSANDVSDTTRTSSTPITTNGGGYRASILGPAPAVSSSATDLSTQPAAHPASANAQSGSATSSDADPSRVGSTSASVDAQTKSGDATPTTAAIVESDAAPSIPGPTMTFYSWRVEAHGTAELRDHVPEQQTRVCWSGSNDRKPGCIRGY